MPGVSANGSSSYFTYDSTPTLLLGGSIEDNLFQIPDVKKELDKLAAAGGNYVRCTMSARDEGNVQAFARTGDGEYDLTEPSEEYWDRFEHFLEATAERDIVVQIELWATLDLYGSRWDDHPFNPVNNRNYDARESMLRETIAGDPPFNSRANANQNTFFWSVPALGNLSTVLGYQRRYADWVLDRTLPYDHVLYCIDNETGARREWGEYWAGYIAEQARQAGTTATITEMFWQPSMYHPQHRAVFDRPEVYDFVEVSQNTNQRGWSHWEHLAHAREQARGRPLSNVKVYGANNGPEWAGDTDEGVDRFWRNLLGGVAATRFHRPPTGIGCSDLALAHLRSARLLADEFDILGAEADAITQDNTAYGAYSRDATVVYFPDGGATTVDHSNRGEAVRWLDPDQSVWTGTGDHSRRLRTPGDGRWIALLE